MFGTGINYKDGMNDSATAESNLETILVSDSFVVKYEENQVSYTNHQFMFGSGLVNLQGGSGTTMDNQNTGYDKKHNYLAWIDGEPRANGKKQGYFTRKTSSSSGN